MEKEDTDSGSFLKTLEDKVNGPVARCSAQREDVSAYGKIAAAHSSNAICLLPGSVTSCCGSKAAEFGSPCPRRNQTLFDLFCSPLRGRTLSKLIAPRPLTTRISSSSLEFWD